LALAAITNRAEQVLPIDLYTNDHVFPEEASHHGAGVQSTWYSIIDRNQQKYVPNKLLFRYHRQFHVRRKLFRAVNVLRGFLVVGGFGQEIKRSSIHERSVARIERK
jgi:hypothetical protein